MKLTTDEAIAIAQIAEWFKTDKDILIHKLLAYQIEYIQQVQENCFHDQCTIQKYELARRYKLLD